MSHLIPIFTQNAVRMWDPYRGKFVNNPPALRTRKPMGPRDHGSYIVLIPGGYVTVGKGRNKRASRHDASCNVYDRVNHLYAIYGAPSLDIQKARHWRSRQAAWRCAKKLHGRIINLRRRNVDHQPRAVTLWD